MDDLLKEFFHNQAAWALAGMIVVILALLAKSADKLVGEAVVLSERSGLPKVIVGATIVSLGTTAPEAAVSVLAAVKGNSGLALGNAVGSIICDTGLILGIACLINPLKLPRQIVNRQGWLQLGSGLLLVAACWPKSMGANPWKVGGNLPQVLGMGFVALLVGYLTRIETERNRSTIGGIRTRHCLAVAAGRRQTAASDCRGSGMQPCVDSSHRRCGAAAWHTVGRHCRHAGCLWHFAAGAGDRSHCCTKRSRRPSDWQHHRGRYSQCAVRRRDFCRGDSGWFRYTHRFFPPLVPSHAAGVNRVSYRRDFFGRSTETTVRSGAAAGLRRGDGGKFYHAAWGMKFPTYSNAGA